jgi:hypothetical protein
MSQQYRGRRLLPAARIADLYPPGIIRTFNGNRVECQKDLLIRDRVHAFVGLPIHTAAPNIPAQILLRTAARPT